MTTPPMPNQRFYLSEEKTLAAIERLIQNAVSNGTIRQTDELCIRKFLLSKEQETKAGRKYKLCDTLILLRRDFFPEYVKCSTEDFLLGCARLSSAKKADGSPRFKQNTINDRLKIIKSFVLYLCKQEKRAETAKQKHKEHWMIPYLDDFNIDKDEIIDYKPISPVEIVKTELNVISPDEILKLFEAAHCPRDRSMIELFYECGFRISEIGNLRWGDIDNEMHWIKTNGKTGKTRTIPIALSRTDLAEWKRDYPMKITDESFVFVNYRRSLQSMTYREMTYSAITKILQHLIKNAGINRKILPHDFRHTRITHMLLMGIPPMEVSLQMWGTVNSSMIKRYAHLSNDDRGKIMSEIYGIPVETLIGDKAAQKNIEKLVPKICPICSTLNNPVAKYCMHCGNALTENSIDRQSKLKNEIETMLFKDPTFLTQVLHMKEFDPENNEEEVKNIN